MLQRVAGGACVLAVVGADRYRVKAAFGYHFFVIGVVCGLDAEFFEEGGGPAGNEIGSGYHLDVVELLVSPHVRMGDAPGTDKSHSKLSPEAQSLPVSLADLLEKVEIFVVCHLFESLRIIVL